jgi:cytochrome c
VTIRTLILLICSLLLLGAELGCDREAERHAAAITGGDVHAGRDKIDYYGCGSCHQIPGVRGADSLVGPPLDHVASRMYIGGVLRNTPDDMIRWIQNPPAIDAKTAMPNVHVTESDARDIAGYLYTLR